MAGSSDGDFERGALCPGTKSMEVAHRNEFAHNFADVGAAIFDLCCSLEQMYDCLILTGCASPVRTQSVRNGAQVMHDAWFGDALFFVAHQLRFSARVETFQKHLFAIPYL